MFLLLSSALEYSLNTGHLLSYTKINPWFQHPVAKDSIGSFISVHAFRNSPWSVPGKRSLGTWFT